MKTLIASLYLILFLSSSFAQTQQEEFSARKRIVAGRTFDLSPLIDWSSDFQNKSPRPMTNWFLIQGTIVGNSAYGWIVQGKVAKQSQRFILRNPPAAQLLEFQKLKKEYQDLLTNAQMANQNYTQAKRSLSNAHLQQSRIASAPVSQDIYTANRQAAAYDNASSAVSQAASAKLGTQMKFSMANEAVASFDSHGYDLKGNFPVNCLAIKLPQIYNGLPIYDRGIPMK